ncbi:hypothetical protein E2562_022634 [Oryza meyeriana var. granulata]|uniref:Uncharacterized protein n=1 Tax=Oryza meyeriana var. granulata TaxID=110450 RepID=A0A6G1CSG4_9ORYZ|nr:hypothetical protein E2562_022634 [Oryza meyeriana var. granulata]
MKSPRKKSPGKEVAIHLVSTEAPLKTINMSWVPDWIEASVELENIEEPDGNEGEGQEVACTDIVLATQGSHVVAGLPSRLKEADNWGEDDEVEYVGVDNEKEKYKDLVSDDETVDLDYDPGSDEDNDDLTVDDEEGCELIKKLPYKHNCASITGVENNCMARNSWVRDRGPRRSCLQLRPAQRTWA